MDLDKLRVYAKSQELLSEVLRLAASLPRGWGFLADQLRRAGASVPLNIAEGWGRPEPGDRRRSFDMALGSLHEVAAAVEILRRAGYSTREEFLALWDEIDHISRMLGRLRANAR